MPFYGTILNGFTESVIQGRMVGSNCRIYVMYLRLNGIISVWLKKETINIELDLTNQVRNPQYNYPNHHHNIERCHTIHLPKSWSSTIAQKKSNSRTNIQNWQLKKYQIIIRTRWPRATFQSGSDIKDYITIVHCGFTASQNE